MAITDPVLVLVDQELAVKLAPLVGDVRKKNVGPVYSYESLGHLPPQVGRAIPEVGNPSIDSKLLSDVDNGVGIETLGHDDDGMIYFTSG